MTTLEQARAAAEYMQKYARGFRARHVELAKGVNPKEGYGNGANVISAHRSALFLHERAQALFNPCSIPERYGSPTALRDELEGFDLELAQRESKLRDDTEAAFSAKQMPPETLGMVMVEVMECRAAVRTALDLMGTPPAPGGSDTFQVLEMIARQFPHVVRQMGLRRAPAAPFAVANEYDVQYLFQGLLALFFDDIRPEEPGPSIAGSSSRVDSFLAPQQTVVEFKMTRKGLGEAALGKELFIDFAQYAERPGTKNLFVFVYDPSKKISNPGGFQRQLSIPRPPIDRVRVFVQQA